MPRRLIEEEELTRTPQVSRGLIDHPVIFIIITTRWWVNAILFIFNTFVTPSRAS